MVEADTCKPSGKLRGKKPPPGKCNKGHDSDCCKEGKFYNTYKCSPPVSNHTKATLTLNGFDSGEDGGSPCECDDKFHEDSELIVALSTGWFNKKKRCMKYINIHGNGKIVKAKVVDECDSTMGCDDEHDFQPPCANNIVDASDAVWDSLGVCGDKRGKMEIYCKSGNDKGDWVVGFSRKIGRTDSLQAKLWGIREGLKLAISLNIRSLTVELDAMMVVHLLKMPLDDIHLLSTLMRDCLLLIVEMGVMQIQHIFRESNKCVNHLANLAQNSDLDMVVLNSPPASLLPFF
ncbi:hypothetical protein Goshw_010403 [Gossypium schwendimanii]|uniref:RNase H type-1 domain-containing protein n=1 Tax=Gossypium schwendimanii TaxID=34291 RepID=A0A7J9NAZ8_GOSSC|nr:hypothetical protein [Gossypium schwendimanii]